MEMTQMEAEEVIQAIMDRTSAWVDAHLRLDAEGVMDIFENSADLKHAENGMIFPSFDAIAELVDRWSETASAMEYVWQERHVLPLAPDAAVLTSTFSYRTTFKSGEVKSGHAAFTGVFVRRNGVWRIVHGHESAPIQS
jgi:uncharacterized protein (TIGR02246 family)